MLKKIIIIFLVLIGLIPNFVDADFSSYEGFKKDCLELLEGQDTDLDISSYIDNDSYLSPNDGLTGINYGINSDFVNEEIDDNNGETNFFYFDTYSYGNKANLKKRNYELYLDDDDRYFYDKELNFVEIDNGGIKEFLQCNYSKNTSLDSNINNNLFLYEYNYSDFDIEEITHNGNKWKKIITTNYFKDSTGEKDVFKVEKISFVPYNESLDSYYNLYEISSIFGEKLEFFKQRLEKIQKDSSNIKEIYSDNNIIISKYNFSDGEMSDEYGIRYVFINGVNYIGDFESFVSYHTFEYLLNKGSSLIHYMYLFDYQEDNKRDYLKHIIFWSKYELGFIEFLPKDEIIGNLYFKSVSQLVKRNYYKVTDIISKENFYNYFYNNIYTNNNVDLINNLEELLVGNNLFNKVSEFLKENYENGFKDQYIATDTTGSNEIVNNEEKTNKIIIILLVLVFIIGLGVGISINKKK